jgi:PadR family transcriptional regulator PadR
LHRDEIPPGTLYLLILRTLVRGWVRAECGATAENRRARYYQLTEAGRKQLEAEISQYERVTQAIPRVIQPA